MGYLSHFTRRETQFRFNNDRHEEVMERGNNEEHYFKRFVIIQNKLLDEIKALTKRS